MKTRSKWFRLRSLVTLTLGLAVSAGSAFAGQSMMTREAMSASAPIQQPAQKRVVYYVMSSASAIPKPISYVIGGVLTTAIPIQIIGRGTTVSR